MKLAGSCLLKSWRTCELVRVLSWYSTASPTALTSSSSSLAAEDESLFRRISPEGNPNASVVPILDQWLQEGRPVHRDELHSLVRRLKSYRRYTHALQVSEWSEKMYGEISHREISFRLELISKIHGLDLAEKYFDSLPLSSRVPQVYYSLLQSYVRAKSLKKAEAPMWKLKEIGLAQSSFPYNIMMKIYAELGMHSKLDEIMQEMEEKGIWWNRRSCYIRLNAYAIASDIKGMEMFLRKMEGDPQHTIDWIVYTIAANGYLNAGHVDKCLVMLKRVERLATGSDKKRAYQFLLTFYGRAKMKDEVYRIWKLYKSWWNVYNKGYLYMVSSLVKADDLEGAENIVEEYDSETKEYDYRVINVLIRAYGRKGCFEKAEALVSKGMKHGKEPPTSTWDILAAGYCINKQMEAAAKTFKKALLAERRGWKLNRLSLAACLDYLKQKGDLGELEELTSLLRNNGYPSETLLLDALQNGIKTCDFSDQIEEDDVEKIISPFEEDGLCS